MKLRNILLSSFAVLMCSITANRADACTNVIVTKGQALTGPAWYLMRPIRIGSTENSTSSLRLTGKLPTSCAYMTGIQVNISGLSTKWSTHTRPWAT